MAEWDLTPLHFRDLGSTKLYCQLGEARAVRRRPRGEPGKISKAAMETPALRLDFRLVAVLSDEVDLLHRLRCSA